MLDGYAAASNFRVSQGELSNVGSMSSANEIIMDRPQGSRKDLTSLDEPPVKLCLDALMPSFFLVEICELDERSDLSLQNGKICATGTGVKVSLFIGSLSRAKAVLSFC